MSTAGNPGSKAAAAAAAATTTAAAPPALDSVLEVTKPKNRDALSSVAKELWRQASEGAIKIPKARVRLIDEAIRAIDQLLSKQVSAILHHPDLQRLEGSWRGLHQLVTESQTGPQLQIKLLNITKDELGKDLEKGGGGEFDQCQIFQKVYESEYGMAGGKPFSAVIADYQFAHGAQDVEILEKLAGIGAQALCPVITSPSPELFKMDSFEGLAHVRDVAKIFMEKDYARWNGFRGSADACWVTMAMPRTLARLPYGKATRRVEGFDFEELESGKDGKPAPAPHDAFCWSSAAYALGTVLTRAFEQHAWCTAIRGREGGGTVERLPCYTFIADDGDLDLKCPTEVGITDRKESELSKLGFLPLCHFKDTDFSVFFGAQTVQKPKEYLDAAASANAQIGARLPYLMAASRIGHYLKCAGRDWIGSFAEMSDLQHKLSKWLSQYVLDDATPNAEMKAKYPLQEAKVEVQPVPGRPGEYRVVAHLRPWLQLEALTASLRMVADIPKSRS